MWGLVFYTHVENTYITSSYHKEGMIGLILLLLTDFVCLYTYEFWLSLCKIVRSSVILLLPLLKNLYHARRINGCTYCGSKNVDI
jgi:hypothetical protein